MATTVQLNNDAEWDDEPYAVYEKDFENYSDYGNGSDYDESFFSDIGGIIKTGVQSVGNILTNPIGTAAKAVTNVGKILGVNPSPASTAGIQNRGGIAGSITTAQGKKIPVQLPEAAHKRDIQILQEAIKKINSEIKQVADTTTNNGVALTKLTKEVKNIDDKHITATKKQNELISRLGTGVDKLGKDLKALKNQEQMNMMLSVFLQPKLEAVTFASATGADGNPLPILSDEKEIKVKSSKSTDNTLLMLMMGMMGGDSSSSNGTGGGGPFGDMSSNPLMMIMMMKAFSGDGGIL